MKASAATSIARIGLCATMLLLPVVGKTAELTRDNAARPIVFLTGPAPDRMMHEGKELEIWLRESGTTNFVQKTHSGSATGFLVRVDSQTYLVTANHVARDTSLAWSAVVSGQNNRAISIPFPDFTGHTNDLPWIQHPRADVAALPIQADSLFSKSGLMERFGMSVFVSGLAAPPRDRTLTIIGFPLGLGINQKKISPLVKESKAASGLYDIPVGTNTTTVFFLADPSIDGYSGAPIFVFPIKIGGRGGVSIQVGPRATHCYGLVKGTVQDRTGGKLAVVVPSFHILETLQMAQQESANEENAQQKDSGDKK